MRAVRQKRVGGRIQIQSRRNIPDHQRHCRRRGSRGHSQPVQPRRSRDYGILQGCENQPDGKAAAASALRGGVIEVHTDSIGGPLVAELKVDGTGGWEEWRTFQTPVKAAPQGVKDLFFVFKGRKGPKLFNFDYWTFE